MFQLESAVLTLKQHHMQLSGATQSTNADASGWQLPVRVVFDDPGLRRDNQLPFFHFKSRILVLKRNISPKDERGINRTFS